VAEVSVQTRDGAALRKALLASVRKTVSKLDSRNVRGGPFLVSAALVRIQTEQGKHGLQSTAFISTSLRRKSSGALVASTRGRATAIVPGGTTSETESSAVEAAVESALSDVPRALRKN